MIDIRYKKIHIEGFRSVIQPLTFELDRVGLNMIKGTNGVGKSTIFNALLWCEFGVNLKKSIEPWVELRTADYKGVRVMVERTIGDKDYLICRHQNYKGLTLGLKGESKVLIFVKSVDEAEFEDKHLIDAKYKDDQQQEIINQLGMDDKTFLQSILFGQKMAGLVESSSKDTRSLLDNLFDVHFVAEAADKAKTRLSELDADISNMDTKIQSYEHTIDKTFGLVEDLEKNRDAFEDVKKQKIERLTSEQIRIKSELKSKKADEQEAIKLLENTEEPNFTEIKQEYNDFRDKSESLYNDKRDAERKVKSAENSINSLKHNIEVLDTEIQNVETHCSTCGAELSKDKVKEVVQKLKDRKKTDEESLKILEKNLKDHQDYLNKITKEEEAHLSKEDEVQKRYNNYNEEHSNYLKIKNAIAPITKRIEELEMDLKYKSEELKEAQNNEYDNTALANAQKQLDDAKKGIKKAEKNKEEFEEERKRVYWWAKKGFGASGLKSFVFNSMLTKLNSIAQKYAEKLGFGVEFTIDMTKESKPFKMLVYKGSEVKDYEDLSGGQQQRVIVCIAFAMHELVTSSKSRVNLLIMDETITYMDNAGIEAFFSLISGIAEEKSVYLITHLELINPVNTKTITLGLQDGSTIILD